MVSINTVYDEEQQRYDQPLVVEREQYYGNNKKGVRQSAANILPILVKKGLISDYRHKK